MNQPCCEPDTYPFVVRRWGLLFHAVYGRLGDGRGERWIGTFLLPGRAYRFVERANLYITEAAGGLSRGVKS